MQRRDFLKLTSLFGITTGSGILSYQPTWAAQNIKNSSTSASLKNRTILPIPPLLYPDTQGKLKLTLQEGITQFNSNIATKTWGINQNFLGPAIMLDVHKDISVTINNQLPDATTLHWHGLVIPGASDGGPQDLIQPQQSQTIYFNLNQPAATCWVHPHIHGSTGAQVMKGLAGLVLINDEKSKALPIPKEWGKDDIPVILQDKQFEQNGQIAYKLDIMSAAIGWFGNRMLTNGTEYPYHIAPKGWLRLRFLNGCNARTLNLTTSDGRPFYVIASDGGFLSEPIKLSQLPIWMGERFEILVNTSDGKAFDIVTEPTQQMGMNLPPFNQSVPVLTIQPSSETNIYHLPDHLVDMPELINTTNLPQRILHLTMNPQLDQMGMQAFQDQYGHHSMDHMKGMSMHHNHHNMMHEKNHSTHSINFHNGNMINDKTYDMNHPLFDVKQGQYEKWIVSGEGDMMLHPFHIHGTQFRILSENGNLPAPHRTGWKDIVHVEGKRSEVLVRFDHLANAKRSYMAHCHLLEHEDTGMMCGFTVSA